MPCSLLFPPPKPQLSFSFPDSQSTPTQPQSTLPQSPPAQINGTSASTEPLQATASATAAITSSNGVPSSSAADLASAPNMQAGPQDPAWSYGTLGSAQRSDVGAVQPSSNGAITASHQPMQEMPLSLGTAQTGNQLSTNGAHQQQPSSASSSSAAAGQNGNEPSSSSSSTHHQQPPAAQAAAEQAGLGPSSNDAQQQLPTAASCGSNGRQQHLAWSDGALQAATRYAYHQSARSSSEASTSSAEASAHELAALMLSAANALQNKSQSKNQTATDQSPSPFGSSPYKAAADRHDGLDTDDAINKPPQQLEGAPAPVSAITSYMAGHQVVARMPTTVPPPEDSKVHIEGLTEEEVQQLKDALSQGQALRAPVPPKLDLQYKVSHPLIEEQVLQQEIWDQARLCNELSLNNQSMQWHQSILPD